MKKPTPRGLAIHMPTIKGFKRQNGEEISLFEVIKILNETDILLYDSTKGDPPIHCEGDGIGNRKAWVDINTTEGKEFFEKHFK